MNKRNLSIIIVVGVLIIILIMPYLPKGNASETIIDSDTKQSFKTEKETKINKVEIISSNNSVELRYFWSEYCPYCKKEEPILQEILGEHPTLKFVRIDVSKEEAIPEMKKYGVTGTPTHVLVDEKSIKIAVGFLDKEQLTKFICQKLRDEECHKTQTIPDKKEGQSEEEDREPLIVSGGFCQ